MKGETSKAFDRRIREGWFAKYAPDNQTGIDIGCQHDPLNHTFRRWDLIFGDGDATYMAGVPDETFHTVYVSHVLEHLNDPVEAVRNWWRILKPGGHLIVIVPHRDLYERKTELPSKWNHDHKRFYLPEDLASVIGQAIPSIIQLRVLSDGWIDLPNDQHPVGEYSIEAIMKKGDV